MRCFLALTPDTPALAFLATMISTLRATDIGPHVRWVADHDLHLTLRFFDELDDAKRAELPAALELGGISPLALTLTTPRFFPNRKFPRVVVCMLERNSQLRLLAQRCEAAAQLISLPAEKRDFSAHVTLGRIKEDAPGGLRLPQIAATQPQPMGCDRITLFQSTLTPKGVLYETVRHWGLVEQTPGL